MDRTIRMIFRMFVREGTRQTMRHMLKGDEAEGQGGKGRKNRGQGGRETQEMSKRARQAMRMTRRFGKF